MINSKNKIDLVVHGKKPKSLTMKQMQKICFATIKKLKIKGMEIGVVFVSLDKMVEYNFKYMRRRQPTDVLSFGYQEKGSKFLQGDVIICPDYVTMQATELGFSANKEFNKLLIHGLLHIAGYKHKLKADKELMLGLQENILSIV